MASWVAPSIAAEMWNTTVTELLDRAHRGELRTLSHGEFMFIDIDPARPELHDGRPPTFTLVSQEEERALFEPIDFATARPVVAATRVRPMAA